SRASPWWTRGKSCDSSSGGATAPTCDTTRTGRPLDKRWRRGCWGVTRSGPVRAWALLLRYEGELQVVGADPVEDHVDGELARLDDHQVVGPRGADDVVDHAVVREVTLDVAAAVRLAAVGVAAGDVEANHVADGVGVPDDARDR